MMGALRYLALLLSVLALLPTIPLVSAPWDFVIDPPIMWYTHERNWCPYNPSPVTLVAEIDNSGNLRHPFKLLLIVKGRVVFEFDGSVPRDDATTLNYEWFCDIEGSTVWFVVFYENTREGKRPRRVMNELAENRLVVKRALYRRALVDNSKYCYSDNQRTYLVCEGTWEIDLGYAGPLPPPENKPIVRVSYGYEWQLAELVDEPPFVVRNLWLDELCSLHDNLINADNIMNNILEVCGRVRSSTVLGRYPSLSTITTAPAVARESVSGMLVKLRDRINKGMLLKSEMEGKVVDTSYYYAPYYIWPLVFERVFVSVRVRLGRPITFVELGRYNPLVEGALYISQDLLAKLIESDIDVLTMEDILSVLDMCSATEDNTIRYLEDNAVRIENEFVRQAGARADSAKAAVDLCAAEKAYLVDNSTVRRLAALVASLNYKNNVYIGIFDPAAIYNIVASEFRVIPAALYSEASLWMSAAMDNYNTAKSCLETLSRIGTVIRATGWDAEYIVGTIQGIENNSLAVDNLATNAELLADNARGAVLTYSARARASWGAAKQMIEQKIGDSPLLATFIGQYIAMANTHAERAGWGKIAVL